MAQVNPPPNLKIPEAFQKDPEVFAYLKDKDFIIYQLWLRSGGAEDGTDDNDLHAINANVGLSEQIEDLQNNIVPFPVEFSERLESIENQLSQNQVLELFELVNDLLSTPSPAVIPPQNIMEFRTVTGTNTQLVDDDVVYFNSASPFTFNLILADSAHKIVRYKNLGAGTVTLNPAGSDTTETTSLTTTVATTLGPNAGTGWASL